MSQLSHLQNNDDLDRRIFVSTKWDKVQKVSHTELIGKNVYSSQSTISDFNFALFEYHTLVSVYSSAVLVIEGTVFFPSGGWLNAIPKFWYVFTEFNTFQLIQIIFYMVKALSCQKTRFSLCILIKSLHCAESSKEHNIRAKALIKYLFKVN